MSDHCTFGSHSPISNLPSHAHSQNMPYPPIDQSRASARQSTASGDTNKSEYQVLYEQLMGPTSTGTQPRSVGTSHQAYSSPADSAQRTLQASSYPDIVLCPFPTSNRPPSVGSTSQTCRPRNDPHGAIHRLRQAVSRHSSVTTRL